MGLLFINKYIIKNEALTKEMRKFEVKVISASCVQGTLLQIV